MKPFLQAALAAAEAAAEDIMHYYRGNFEVELKPDQTPVTVADRRAEEIIKGILVSMVRKAAGIQPILTICGWSIP